MNCQSFEEMVTELARDRISGQTMEISEISETSLRERALVHVDECAACALRLQDQRALSRGLNEMAREMKSLTAPARVEAELLRAFRQRSEVRGRRSEVRTEWNRWVLAAAAVLLIVLGIGGLRRYVLTLQSPKTGGTQNALAQTSPKPAPLNIEISRGNSPSKPDKESAGNLENMVKRTNPQPQRRPFNRDSNTPRQVLATTADAIASDTESEVATRFVPLDYAGPINLQDGGQLVRVELPRSAMLNLGLPVNMDRYSERVKADVFVGADGLARAIRFVQ
jgi:hypothetical protein